MKTREYRIKRYRDIAIIFLLALSIRLWVMNDLRSNPFFDHPVIDADTYHVRAIDIAKGKLLEKQSFWQAPGYPYFLGFLYWLLGPSSFIGVRIIQSIMGSLSCVLLYLIGRFMFSRRVSLLAGILLSLYPTLVFLDLELLNPVLENFLLLLFFYLLYLAWDMQKPGYYGIAGLVAGLLAVTRGSIILFVLYLLLMSLIFKQHYYVKTKGDKATNISSIPILSKRAMIRFLPLFLLPIGVTAWHNYHVEKVFVPICSNNGLNFYLGNNKDYIKTVGIRPGDDWEYLIEEPLRLKGISRSDLLSDYWINKGLGFYKDNPILGLRLLLKKTYLLFRGHEILRNQNIYAFRQYSTYIRLTLFKIKGFLAFPLGLLFPLAFVGIFLTLYDWRRLLLLYGFLLTHALFVLAFFVTARYRLPMIPFLILFASAAVFSLYKERRNTRIMITCLALFLGVFIISNARTSRINEVQDESAGYNLGWLYQNEGRYEDAKKWYMYTLKINPEHTSANLNMGVILSKYDDKPDQALAYFDKILSKRPNYVKALRNKAISLYLKGDFERGISILLGIYRKDNKDTTAKTNLIWGLKKYIDKLADKKEYALAEKYLLIYKEIDPDEPDIDINLRVVRRLQGK